MAAPTGLGWNRGALFHQPWNRAANARNSIELNSGCANPRRSRIWHNPRHPPLQGPEQGSAPCSKHPEQGSDWHPVPACYDWVLGFWNRVEQGYLKTYVRR